MILFPGCNCCGWTCYGQDSQSCFDHIRVRIKRTGTTGADFDTSENTGLPLNRYMPLVNHETRHDGGKERCQFDFASVSPVRTNCSLDGSASLSATRVNITFSLYRDGTTDSLVNTAEGSIRLNSGPEQCATIPALQFISLPPGLGERAFSLNAVNSSGDVIGQLHFTAEVEQRELPYDDFRCFDGAAYDNSWYKVPGSHPDYDECSDNCGTCGVMQQPPYDTQIQLTTQKVGNITVYSGNPDFGCHAGKDFFFTAGCTEQDLLDSVPAFNFTFSEYHRCLLDDQAQCQPYPGVLADHPVLSFGLPLEDQIDGLQYPNWKLSGFQPTGLLLYDCGPTYSSVENRVQLITSLYPPPSCLTTAHLEWYEGLEILGVAYFMGVPTFQSTATSQRQLYGYKEHVTTYIDCYVVIEDTNKPEGDEFRHDIVRFLRCLSDGAFLSGVKPLP